MLTAKTTKLDLMQGWFDSDPKHSRVHVAFPINKWVGSRDSAVVYFEVKPGPYNDHGWDWTAWTDIKIE